MPTPTLVGSGKAKGALFPATWKHGWSKHGSSITRQIQAICECFDGIMLEPCLLQPCFHVAGFPAPLWALPSGPSRLWGWPAGSCTLDPILGSATSTDVCPFALSHAWPGQQHVVIVLGCMAGIFPDCPPPFCPFLGSFGPSCLWGLPVGSCTFCTRN